MMHPDIFSRPVDVSQVTTCSYCDLEARSCATVRDGDRVVVVRFCEGLHHRPSPGLTLSAKVVPSA